MTVKLLTKHHLGSLSLTGGCTGSSESTLVKMPHCGKSHVTAHIELYEDEGMKALLLLETLSDEVFVAMLAFFFSWLYIIHYYMVKMIQQCHF